MSDKDEKRPEEEEVAEAAAEQSEEGSDVEGHKWHHGTADKASEPDKASRAY